MAAATKEEEVPVVIVGAGPAGLAASACLNCDSILNIVLERENCSASLWKKRAYDRLKLHLAKQFCSLPHMLFPPEAPTFVPRKGFIQYLDDYESRFNVKPYYCRSVESASYDEQVGKWRVVAENTLSGECESYIAKRLVVASGENCDGVIPNVPGLESFEGEVMHSNKYENALRLAGKRVLVVGCGNSGMEISYDLSNYGVETSIVVRSPVHVLTKEMVFLGMTLLKYLPVKMVDTVVVLLSRLKYGNCTKYGLERPKIGPFQLKTATGRTPTIDVGATEKIMKGEINVFPAIKNIAGGLVTFANGKKARFDAIIFATGYKTNVRKWLKGGNDLFNDNGMPQSPLQWKGNNGLYCVGFSKRGLLGISVDAKNVARDISFEL